MKTKRSVVVVFGLLVATGTIVAQTRKGELYDPQSVKIEQLPVNTVQSDFGPALIGDTLYFTSYRNELLYKNENRLRKREFYDLHRIAVDDSGKVAGERELVGEFVSRYHDGPVAWCEKSGELFITQSNYQKPASGFRPFRENKVNLRITVTKMAGGKWQEAVELPFCNSDYSVAHPAVTVTGDTLIFASDMPGGFGGTDLYMSVRKGGNWGSPVNLGEKINTSGKDAFPFVTEDGFLIFASDSREGLGGLDLFYTRLPIGEVIHLEGPVNSPYDDFAADFPPHAEYAYISSNRPGMGNDDIYRLTFRKYIEYLMEIRVYDAKSHRPIPGAEVKFSDLPQQVTGSNGMVGRTVERDKRYDLTVKAFGYEDETKSVTVGNLKEGSVLRDTVWMKMMVKKAIELKNIYYDFDKWNILPESEAELNRLVAFMAENPEVTVEWSSHTDSRGSDAYNLVLSQKRAQSAVDYILSKGIDSDRIIAKGYGEEKLLNNCRNGVACTPEEHRMNRRTEFMIPGITSSLPDFETVKKQAISEPPRKTTYNPVPAVGKSASSLPQKVYDKYYIVLGSFMDRANADKLLKQALSEGLKAKIISETQPYKVVIGYTGITQAKNDLISLKGKYPNAWIF